MCQFEIVNRQMVFKAIRQHGITKRRRARPKLWNIDGKTSKRGERVNKEAEKEQPERQEENQAGVVPWKPREESISRKKEGSIVSDAANWSHKTRTENSLLDLITWRSGL